MKSFLILAVSIASVMPSLAQAQIRLPSYRDLCSYESACGKAAKVKTTKVDGQKRVELVPKRPPVELMVYYKSLRGLIISVANEYQIDPVTLVATPLAENTMNVHIDDKIADMMDDQGLLDDDGAVVNPMLKLAHDKPMSIGPGQIYVHAAKNVEPLAALIERRPLREKKEIKRQLKTPEGALRYAAAIIRDAQEVYARGGVDISKRPEILATLYNIGKVKSRLSNNRGREPLPNYFGFFVGINYSYIQTELDLPSTIYQNH
ncbi:MAG: DUF1402 family protein [Proteobacteria bacterium]|nr:MAG: DUF1402 family protein [Pseudomonadota bacterium]